MKRTKSRKKNYRTDQSNEITNKLKIMVWIQFDFEKIIYRYPEFGS